MDYIQIVIVVLFADMAVLAFGAGLGDELSERSITISDLPSA